MSVRMPICWYLRRLEAEIMLKGKEYTMKIQENIKCNLRSIMKKRNLSLTEFAEDLGIGRSSLQRYLDGNSNPRADTIQLFADRLNIPVEILVGGFKPEYAKTIDDLPELLVDLHSHLKSMSEVSYKLHLTCDALDEILFGDSDED